MKIDSTSLAAGLCGGVLAGAAGIPLLPGLAEAAGPLPLAASAALLCATAVVAFRARGGAAHPDPYPAAGQEPGPPALTAREWALERGILGFGDAMDGLRLRKALAAQLTQGHGYRDPLYDLLVRIALMARMRVQLPHLPGLPDDRRETWDSGPILRKLAARPEPDVAVVILDDLRAQSGSVRWGHVEAEVARLQRLHAFRETVLMAALDDAREAYGPLPCSEFAWLRRVDRNLWFALQNLGHGGGFVEGLGALSHYRAEMAVRHGLPHPVVEPAAEAVLRFVQERGHHEAALPAPRSGGEAEGGAPAPEEADGGLPEGWTPLMSDWCKPEFRA